MTNPTDLLGTGKALERFISSVADGIGAIATPLLKEWTAKKEVRAFLAAEAEMAAAGYEVETWKSETLNAGFSRRMKQVQATKLLNSAEIAWEAARYQLTEVHVAAPVRFQKPRAVPLGLQGPFGC